MRCRSKMAAQKQCENEVEIAMFSPFSSSLFKRVYFRGIGRQSRVFCALRVLVATIRIPVTTFFRVSKDTAQSVLGKD
jgi:hypothetical protein